MPRKGDRKVRTGCYTCKIRKVKCDEAKPNCLRCSSTGRKCDGYPTKDPRRSTPSSCSDVQVHGTPLTSRDVSPVRDFVQYLDTEAEVHSVEYFQTVTAPSLAGAFDAHFWISLVTQASCTEPAVRHAVMALGYLHEKFKTSSKFCDGESSSSSLTSIDTPESFALHHYNKAIALLRARISDISNQAREVTVLTCIIFICIEFLQGRIPEALSHFQQGLKVLCTTDVEDNFASLQVAGCAGNRGSDLVTDHFVPIFNRLSLLSLTFGFSPPAPQNALSFDARFLTTIQIPHQFATLEDARSTQVRLMNLCLRLVRFADAWKFNGHRFDSVPFEPISDEYPLRELQEHQLNLQNVLDRWTAAFSRCTYTINPQSLKASRLLRIYNHISSIWVGAALAQPETAFDQYIPSFRAVIALALQIASDEQSSLDQSNECEPAFSFEMRTIPPLYFTAIKCRHMDIRLFALRLLRHSHARQEGLFNASALANVAGRAVMIEHAIDNVACGLLKTLLAEMSSDDLSNDDNVLPPEERRIHDIEIDERNRRVVDGQMMTKVKMLTKPSGDWIVREEWIAM